MPASAAVASVLIDQYQRAHAAIPETPLGPSVPAVTGGVTTDDSLIGDGRPPHPLGVAHRFTVEQADAIQANTAKPTTEDVDGIVDMAIENGVQIPMRAPPGNEINGKQQYVGADWYAPDGEGTQVLTRQPNGSVRWADPQGGEGDTRPLVIESVFEAGNVPIPAQSTDWVTVGQIEIASSKLGGRLAIFFDATADRINGSATLAVRLLRDQAVVRSEMNEVVVSNQAEHEQIVLIATDQPSDDADVTYYVQVRNTASNNFTGTVHARELLVLGGYIKPGTGGGDVTQQQLQAETTAREAGDTIIHYQVGPPPSVLPLRPDPDNPVVVEFTADRDFGAVGTFAAGEVFYLHPGGSIQSGDGVRIGSHADLSKIEGAIAAILQARPEFTHQAIPQPAGVADVSQLARRYIVRLGEAIDIPPATRYVAVFTSNRGFDRFGDVAVGTDALPFDARSPRAKWIFTVPQSAIDLVGGAVRNVSGSGRWLNMAADFLDAQRNVIEAKSVRWFVDVDADAYAEPEPADPPPPWSIEFQPAGVAGTDLPDHIDILFTDRVGTRTLKGAALQFAGAVDATLAASPRLDTITDRGRLRFTLTQDQIDTLANNASGEADIAADLTLTLSDNSTYTHRRRYLVNDPALAQGELNVQSDWAVTDDKSDAFIKNKPAIGGKPLALQTFTADALALSGAVNRWQQITSLAVGSDHAASKLLITAQATFVNVGGGIVSGGIQLVRVVTPSDPVELPVQTVLRTLDDQTTLYNGGKEQCSLSIIDTVPDGSISYMLRGNRTADVDASWKDRQIIVTGV